MSFLRGIPLLIIALTISACSKFEEGEKVWIDLPANAVAHEGFAVGKVIKEDGDMIMVEIDKLEIRGSDHELAEVLKPDDDEFFPSELVKNYIKGKKAFKKRKDLAEDYDKLYVKMMSYFSKGKESGKERHLKKIELLKDRSEDLDIQEITMALEGQEMLLDSVSLLMKLDKEPSTDNADKWLELTRDHVEELADMIADNEKAAAGIANIRASQNNVGGASISEKTEKSMSSVMGDIFGMAGKYVEKAASQVRKMREYKTRHNRLAALVNLYIELIRRNAKGVYLVAGMEYFLDNEDDFKEFINSFSKLATGNDAYQYRGTYAEPMDAADYGELYVSNLRLEIFFNEQAKLVAGLKKQVNALLKNKNKDLDQIKEEAEALFDAAYESVTDLSERWGGSNLLASSKNDVLRPLLDKLEKITQQAAIEEKQRQAEAESQALMDEYDAMGVELKTLQEQQKAMMRTRRGFKNKKYFRSNDVRKYLYKGNSYLRVSENFWKKMPSDQPSRIREMVKKNIQSAREALLKADEILVRYGAQPVMTTSVASAPVAEPAPGASPAPLPTQQAATASASGTSMATTDPLDKLYTEALADIKANRLSSPKGACAMDKYALMQQISQGDPRTNKVRILIAARYLALARSKLNKKDYTRANKYAKKSISINPTDEGRALSARIAKSREQNQTGKVKIKVDLNAISNKIKSFFQSSDDDSNDSDSDSDAADE